jgi:hypothetical protein
VEGTNVRVIDDGSGDEPEPWNPARSWRVAVAAVIGSVVAVVLLVPALRSPEEPPNYPLEAAPAAATTTAPLTTTAEQPTTTTIALELVMIDMSTLLGAEVREFCGRASPFRRDRIIDVDEWHESLDDDDWLLNHDSSELEFKVWDAAEALDLERGYLLGLVANYIGEAHDALSDALNAVSDDSEPQEWMYHVARIEISCARANATIVAMLGMSRE